MVAGACAAARLPGRQRNHNHAYDEDFWACPLATVLVKLLSMDAGTTVRQTRTLSVDDRLPRAFETTSAAACCWVLSLSLVVHPLMITRYRFRPAGGGGRRQSARRRSMPDARAAADCRRLADLGRTRRPGGGRSRSSAWQGNVRADWNPAYGRLIIPLVFSCAAARRSVDRFVFLFSVLSNSGEQRARPRRNGSLPQFCVTLVVVSDLPDRAGAGRVAGFTAGASRPRPDAMEGLFHSGLLTAAVAGCR